MAQARCAQCGKSREDWGSPEGYLNEAGHAFCCSGCGQQVECLCPEPLSSGSGPGQEEVRLDQSLVERETLMAPLLGEPEDPQPHDQTLTFREEPEGVL